MWHIATAPDQSYQEGFSDQPEYDVNKIITEIKE